MRADLAARILQRAKERIDYWTNNLVIEAGTNAYSEPTQQGQRLGIVLPSAVEETESEEALYVHEVWVEGTTHVLILDPSDMSVITDEVRPIALARIGYWHPRYGGTFVPNSATGWPIQIVSSTYQTRTANLTFYARSAPITALFGPGSTPTSGPFSGRQFLREVTARMSFIYPSGPSSGTAHSTEDVLCTQAGNAVSVTAPITDQFFDYRITGISLT